MELIKEKKNFFYKLYGLNINSDFYLSELSHAEFETLSHIDINIINGKCPEKIDNYKVSNSYYTVSDNEAMFSAEECGHFYIKNGDTIIIEPIANANYQHLKAYLLSRSFALLMFQRNTIALHGSSILFDNKACVFCGRSGTGKSTLSAALTLQGYDLFSDDLSVITFDNSNNPLIHCGLSNNKLCKDAMEYFNISTENLIKVDNFVNKYALPSSKNFFDCTAKVNILIELSIDYNTSVKNTEVSLTEVFGQEKLQTLFRNIFRNQLLNDVGLKPNYLKSCLNLSKNIRIFKLKRPNNLFTLEEQISLIKRI